jgi:hypothetical protein
MNTIFCVWSGDNEMSPQRRNCFDQFVNTCGCNVILVTKKNLHEFILPEYPLHPAYEYLSETHKADYLRTYLMKFYGGGYSDIKKTTGSWKDSFTRLRQSDGWICGYPEYAGGAAHPYEEQWMHLVGNCAYICKAHTPLTTEWYNEMISILDTKLPELRQHPASSPQDFFGNNGSKYPMGWTEMLGIIFHKICYKYKEKLLKTLPYSIFHSYR